MTDPKPPEGTQPQAMDSARARLLAVSTDFTRRIRRAPRAVLVGLPASGKSRLFNRLVRADISRVSSSGYTTTRPVSASIEGVTFTDTPSLRSGGDGQSDLVPEIREADLVVHVINATGRITDRDLDLIISIAARKSVIVVLNKVDVLSGKELGDVLDAARICLTDQGVKVIPISAKAGTGLERVLEHVASRLDGYVPPKEPPPEEAKGQKADESPERGSLARITLPVLMHSAGAAVAVVLIARSSLPIPFLDVGSVALTQYFLIGHVGRVHQEGSAFFQTARLVLTGVGAFLYFLLCGKFRWVIPALGQLLDALAAFVTTAAVGYATSFGLSFAERFFPPWIRKLLFGRLKEK